TIAPVNDAPDGTITIEGEAREGETLSVDIAQLNDPDGVLEPTYTWLRIFESEVAYTIIAGASDQTYTLTEDDVGAQFRVIVSYVDGGGTTETVESDPTSAVVEQGGLLVTTAEDTVDAFDGETSLREAIDFANSQDNGEETDTITFDSTVFFGD
ncbi:hypothetical protein, partial [Roseibium sp. RKSG952]|uniref:hypothetical protein n=1 Tax=Roseibium sp. RKSG952 TaxID=2529384 RepID=UPI001AD91D02